MPCNVSAISCQEQITFQWCDEDVCCEQNQHT